MPFDPNKIWKLHLHAGKEKDYILNQQIQLIYQYKMSTHSNNDISDLLWNDLMRVFKVTTI